jgi:hypothetical protein
MALLRAPPSGCPVPSRPSHAAPRQQNIKVPHRGAGCTPSSSATPGPARPRRPAHLRNLRLRLRAAHALRVAPRVMEPLRVSAEQAVQYSTSGRYCKADLRAVLQGRPQGGTAGPPRVYLRAVLQGRPYSRPSITASRVPVRPCPPQQCTYRRSPALGGGGAWQRGSRKRARPLSPVGRRAPGWARGRGPGPSAGLAGSGGGERCTAAISCFLWARLAAAARSSRRPGGSGLSQR